MEGRAVVLTDHWRGDTDRHTIPFGLVSPERVWSLAAVRDIRTVLYSCLLTVHQGVFALRERARETAP
ncbi:unnamed protein product [Coregonus sp. 'balchen']|nr:unnamed protein product [Coregonus sp. 'balchen']